MLHINLSAASQMQDLNILFHEFIQKSYKSQLEICHLQCHFPTTNQLHEAPDMKRNYYFFLNMFMRFTNCQKKITHHVTLPFL